LLATATFDLPPPSNAAADSGLTSGFAARGGAATGRTGGLNNCIAQYAADAHSTMNKTKLTIRGKRFIRLSY
jgi:hypothetical protein